MDKFNSCMNIQLFPHQINSINRMEDLEKSFDIKGLGPTRCKTKMGILGDIPGYGKSFSIVSLMARDNMEWKEGGIYQHNINWLTGPGHMYEFYYQENFTKIRENLLVVSTSIISQWDAYLKFSNLKVYVVTTRKAIEKFTPNSVDVVLLSSNMYNLFIMHIQNQGNFCWKRFIYDEPGVTHIPSMKPINAGFYWFITATSDDLYLTAGRRGYGGHFLHSVFRCLTYETVGILTIKNTEDEIKKSFKMPETVFTYHKCLNPFLLKVVKNHISNDINIMIQAGNIRGALEALGGGGGDGNIIDIVTKRKKDELEIAEFKVNYYQQRMPIYTSEYDRWKCRVEVLNNEIADLEEKYKNIKAEDCCICYNNLQNPVLLPKCQHIFCGACILEWYKTQTTCPLCRTQGELSELIHINFGGDPLEEKTNLPEILSKQNTIVKIIQTCGNGKYIIFSDYDETFNQLKSLFLETSINWIELTGTSSTKNKKLLSFKTGNTNVIFLNSKVNCAGINLEEATDIILYHDMDYSVQSQIIGRANRIGRKHNLTVHKFQYC